MNKKLKKIKDLIAQGEGIEIEFKEAKEKLNKDVFKTVCSFLNRNGGHLLLGVKDNGQIVGVSEPDKVLNNFITLANNPEKLNPTFYFMPKIIDVEGKNIIYFYIPESSLVHKTGGKIFDRNNDGDFDITCNHELVSSLYLRKQTRYSENTIYPYAELSDLNDELIERVRIMARNKSGGSYILSQLSDEELLKSFGLIQKDFKTGKTGLTLSAILLFGKDQTILNVLPHHRTDAILRKHNTDRYDDRDDIRTNLLDSYDRLMQFVKKHLPDPFYLEGDLRVSLRTKIFREAVANILIHREYVNAFPAKMIIEKEKVIFENANRPHGYGLIDPESFSPYPKNPKIARVFKEIGLADELGSGVRNLFKYCKIYGNKAPEILEKDIFRIIISVPLAHEVKPKTTEQVTEQATEQATEQVLLEFCKTPRTTNEMMKAIGLKHREHFRAKILQPLLEKGLLQMTIPDKPNSPKQRYITTK
jgi:ATP-dependent DNA helicase RecG